MKSLVLFICIVCLPSKSQGQSCFTRQEKESYKLYSLLIDDLGGPNPPPPPKVGDTLKMSEKLVDSLMNEKRVLAIYPLIEER